MKKMLILATGEVQGLDDGYAQRLFDFGKAVYVTDAKEPKVEITTADTMPKAEEPTEENKKAAKPKKAGGKVSD